MLLVGSIHCALLCSTVERLALTGLLEKSFRFGSANLFSTHLSLGTINIKEPCKLWILQDQILVQPMYLSILLTPLLVGPL